jgi:hypothetical protein
MNFFCPLINKHFDVGVRGGRLRKMKLLKFDLFISQFLELHNYSNIYFVKVDSILEQLKIMKVKFAKYEVYRDST